MASRWSSDYAVAEYRDVQATAMAVDSTGNYALLAGKKVLGLKNLNKFSEPLIKLHKHSDYAVGLAEWNPHSQHTELCALSRNDVVEVININGSNVSLTHTLLAHSRQVNDLNWHPYDPHSLASCSYDRTTCVWDLRDNERPSTMFTGAAGASHIRWNPHSNYVLATSHFGDVKVWDQRKNNSPIYFITAHNANIYCLDWSPDNKHQLSTSSHDGTIKFFDTYSHKQEDTVISSLAPVWIARYTPFEHCILVVAIPPRRRGDNSLLLWNLLAPSSPIHTFIGHSDVILNFDWRLSQSASSDESNYQLVTWSRDQTLRLWQIESFLESFCSVAAEENTNVVDESEEAHISQENEGPGRVCGGELGRIAEVDEILTSEEGSRDAPSSIQGYESQLEIEFSQARFSDSNITVENMDSSGRACALSVDMHGYVVCLNVNFPPEYPHNSPPTFEFTGDTNIDILLQARLLKLLKQSALQRVRKNMKCLEHCVKQFVAALQQTHSFIPYRRMSGANFSNSGLLVCFGRKSSSKAVTVEAMTPKNLSSLTSMNSDSPKSYHCFYPRERSSRLGQRLPRSASRHKHPAAHVYIYDACSLFPVQREIAEKYVLESGGDKVNLCVKNRRAVSSTGRTDLEQVWELAACAATPSPPLLHEDIPWHSHPLSSLMIRSMINFYANIHDVQTAAMLSCVFGSPITIPKEPQHKIPNKSLSPEPVGSCARLSVQEMSNDDTSGLWRPGGVKLPRSNSWSDIYKETTKMVEHTAVSATHSGLIELDQNDVYDLYKSAYADILESWQLFHCRAQVMKFLNSVPSSHEGLDRVSVCQICKKTSNKVFCDNCKRPTLQCVICRTPVRGLASSCIVCSHGGHTHHLRMWFSQHSSCPTGCGCSCITPDMPISC